MARTAKDSKGKARERKQEELDANVDTTGYVGSLYAEIFRLEDLQKATKKRLEVLGVVLRCVVSRKRRPGR